MLWNFAFAAASPNLVLERHMGDLRSELRCARDALAAHRASWEYAFAMGASRHGGEHPTHWLTRARTEKLEQRCRDLEARIAEEEL